MRCATELLICLPLRLTPTILPKLAIYLAHWLPNPFTKSPPICATVSRCRGACLAGIHEINQSHRLYDDPYLSILPSFLSLTRMHHRVDFLFESIGTCYSAHREAFYLLGMTVRGSLTARPGSPPTPVPCAPIQPLPPPYLPG
jgi:hypothetical protein